MNKDSKTIEKFQKFCNELGFTEAPKCGEGLLNGWVCPRCGKVHSPFSTNCDCPPQVITFTGATTGCPYRAGNSCTFKGMCINASCDILKITFSGAPFDDPANFNPDCDKCGHQNSENCNTCTILNK